jgi:hypothetical protein
MVVLVVACGSQPLEPRKTESISRTCLTPVCGLADEAPIHYYADAATVPDRAGDGGDVGQVLGGISSGDLTKDGPDTDRSSAKRLEEAHKNDNWDTPADDGTHTENGVTVIDAVKPAWCVTAGKAAGGCWPTPSICASRGAGCKKRTAWACFALTERTSGKEGVLCLVDYGMCSKVATLSERDPEYSDVSDCVIHRVIQIQPTKK